KETPRQISRPLRKHCLEFQRLEGRHSHSLAVNGTETRQGIPHYEVSCRKPSQFLIAPPQARRKARGHRLADGFGTPDQFINERGREPARILDEAVQFFGSTGAEVRDQGHSPATSLLRDHHAAALALGRRRNDNGHVAVEIFGIPPKESRSIAE